MHWARRRVAASVMLLTALGVAGGVACASPASAEGCSSMVLTITVGSPDANTPTNEPGSGCGSIPGGVSEPVAGSSPAPGTTLSSGPGLPGNATPSASASPAPTATPKPGETDLGGILYLSGLRSNYLWSVNPAESVVELRITLRNVSQSTFDSTARFWIDTSLGNTVSELANFRIDGLRPNETRVVTARLGGLGQWTVLQAHATIKPPTTVDGVALAPITRDSYVFIPPLLAGGIGVFGVGAFFLGKSLVALRLAARARGIL
jgi:hypothetical protein